MALSDFISSPFRVLISSDAAVSADFVGPPPGDEIVLDASINESHDSTAVITDYPVEVGPDNSDSSRKQPDALTLHGKVTGTPLSLLNILDSTKETRGQAAYDALRKIQDEGRTCQVRTSLRTYKDMLIETISVPRNSKNSDGVEFTVKFKRLFTASSTTVDAPIPDPEVPKAASLKDVGAKATGAASTAIQSTTTLLGFANAVGSFIGVQ